MKKTIEVVAALIEKNKKILLCQRKEADSYGLLWEFPGGKVERNESFFEAIKREIKEELNIEIGPQQIIKEFYDENEYLMLKVHLIRCSIRKGKPTPCECKNFGFFSFQEIEKLALAPVDRKIFQYLKNHESLLLFPSK
jgi:8-oxo-dGTP diphosphatase